MLTPQGRLVAMVTETGVQTPGAPSAEAATGSIVLLTRLARVVYRQSGEELIGMRLKSLGALAFLRDHDEASQQALSEGLFVDANSCVLLLNELEAAGYAERRRDPTDRRRHHVVLTPAGRAALERAGIRYAIGGSWASTAFGEPPFKLASGASQFDRFSEIDVRPFSVRVPPFAPAAASPVLTVTPLSFPALP